MRGHRLSIHCARSLWTTEGADTGRFCAKRWTSSCGASSSTYLMTDGVVDDADDTSIGLFSSRATWLARVNRSSALVEADGHFAFCEHAS